MMVAWSVGKYQSMGSGCLPKCPQIRRCRLVILATVCSAIRSWSFGVIHSLPNRRITDLRTLPPLLGAAPRHRLQGKIAASPALAGFFSRSAPAAVPSWSTTISPMKWDRWFRHP